MIPLETVFALLDELRARSMALAENPDTRDAFGFGETAGRLRSIAEMREALDNLVEQNQRGSDDDA